MTNRNTPIKPDRFPADNELGKSIFPTFNVNVPMPVDTAVPGSYHKPAQPPHTEPPKPSKEAK